VGGVRGENKLESCLGSTPGEALLSKLEGNYKAKTNNLEETDAPLTPWHGVRFRVFRKRQKNFTEMFFFF
jgi:hypothetical protein